MEFGVWGLACRVWGLGLRVKGVRFGVKVCRGVGCRVVVLGCTSIPESALMYMV